MRGCQHLLSYTSVGGTYARPKHSSTPEINTKFLAHMARYLPAKQKFWREGNVRNLISIACWTTFPRHVKHAAMADGTDISDIHYTKVLSRYYSSHTFALLPRIPGWHSLTR